MAPKPLLLVIGLMAAVGFAAEPATPAEAASAARARPGQAPAATSSLCAANERRYFSCPVSRGRVVSVCAAPAGADKPLLQYRVGVPGRTPELLFPERPRGGNDQFRLVTESGGKWLVLNLRFRIGATSYVVYRFSGARVAPAAGVAARSGDGDWRYTPCVSDLEQSEFTDLYGLDVFDEGRPEPDTVVSGP